jgi:hypothetical protein
MTIDDDYGFRSKEDIARQQQEQREQEQRARQALEAKRKEIFQKVDSRVCSILVAYAKKGNLSYNIIQDLASHAWYLARETSTWSSAPLAVQVALEGPTAEPIIQFRASPQGTPIPENIEVLGQALQTHTELPVALLEARGSSLSETKRWPNTDS